MAASEPNTLEAAVAEQARARDRRNAEHTLAEPARILATRAEHDQDREDAADTLAAVEVELADALYAVDFYVRATAEVRELHAEREQDHQCSVCWERWPCRTLRVLLAGPSPEVER